MRPQDDDPVQGQAALQLFALGVEYGRAGLSDGLVGHGRSASAGLLFEALSVAEIDLADRTLQGSDRRRDELLRGQYQQVDRLRHAAHLAERQYRHSEPENRLVTAELERRWEAALRELKTVEETLEIKQQQSQCWAIPADLLEMLKEIGPALPELWEQGLFSWS